MAGLMLNNKRQRAEYGAGLFRLFFGTFPAHTYTYTYKHNPRCCYLFLPVMSSFAHARLCSLRPGIYFASHGSISYLFLTTSAFWLITPNNIGAGPSPHCVTAASHLNEPFLLSPLGAREKKCIFYVSTSKWLVYH